MQSMILGNSTFSQKLSLSKRSSAFILGAVVIFQTLIASAYQYETVVSDTVFNSTSKVVIDEKQIEQSQASSLSKLLSTQANLTFSTTFVQPSAIYLRGGDPSHILILVDGVPFYDSSTAYRTLNLDLIDIKSVKRVEIMKGSQTVLYGGQAFSGVISISTLPSANEHKNQLGLMIGSPQTRKVSLCHLNSVSQGSGIRYAIRGSYRDRQSRSPALESVLNYPSTIRTADGSLVLPLFLGEFITKVSWMDEWKETNTITFPSQNPADAIDFEQTNKQGSATMIYQNKSSQLDPKVSVQLVDSKRTLYFPVNESNTSLEDQKFLGQLVNTRAEAIVFKTDASQVRVGLSNAYETFEGQDVGVTYADESQTETGAFVKYSHDWSENLATEVGIRQDRTTAKNVSTHQVGLTLYKNTRFEASTGYKSPSLFQLFSDTYGYKELQPEYSRNYSISHDLKFADWAQLSVTLFETHFDNLIQVTRVAPTTTAYRNVQRVLAKGAELFWSQQLSESYRFSASYGYQEANNVVTGSRLDKRPFVNGSVKLSHELNKANWMIEAAGVGDRIERSRRMSGYMLVNASYTRQLNDGLEVFTRIDNLTNVQYEDALGYWNRGTGVQLGLNTEF